MAKLSITRPTLTLQYIMVWQICRVVETVVQHGTTPRFSGCVNRSANTDQDDQPLADERKTGAVVYPAGRHWDVSCLVSTPLDYRGPIRYDVCHGIVTMTCCKFGNSVGNFINKLSR